MFGNMLKQAMDIEKLDEDIASEIKKQNKSNRTASHVAQSIGLGLGGGALGALASNMHPAAILGGAALGGLAGYGLSNLAQNDIERMMADRTSQAIISANRGEGNTFDLLRQKAIEDAKYATPWVTGISSGIGGFLGATSGFNPWLGGGIGAALGAGLGYGFGKANERSYPDQLDLIASRVLAKQGL